MFIKKEKRKRNMEEWRGRRNNERGNVDLSLEFNIYTFLGSIKGTYEG
jgi:hypothetical protein